MKQMISKRENVHRVKGKVKLILFALLMILAQSGGSRHEPLELARHHLPLRGGNKLERTDPSCLCCRQLTLLSWRLLLSFKCSKSSRNTG